MDYLSEILKILDGALKANASMASNYAGLLADKLEQNGEPRQARMIRERLARAPAALASVQDASNGVGLGQLPTDGESRLHTIDVSHPTMEESTIYLPNAISSRVDEFLMNISRYEEFSKVGAAMSSRLLIYGPPGTGKTRLTRKIAGTLKLPLLTIRCDTLVSSLLGQTSKNLRKVFDYAQSLPCVLFLDEFDALASARGNDRDVGELQRIVIALLQNIDALPESTVLIAATNHDALLDKAIWRRFGFRIPMPLPDKALRESLWQHFLKPFSSTHINIGALANASEGITGSNIEQICLDAKRNAVIHQSNLIDETELLRRLGLNLALTRGIHLTTIDQEVYWLKNWLPKEFPLRTLAKIYNTSTRNITTILKEKKTNGKETEKNQPNHRESKSAKPI